MNGQSSRRVISLNPPGVGVTWSRLTIPYMDVGADNHPSILSKPHRCEREEKLAYFIVNSGIVDSILSGERSEGFCFAYREKGKERWV